MFLFKRAISLISILSFSLCICTCSLFPLKNVKSFNINKKKELIKFKQNMNNFCFTGEGHGKAKITGNRQVSFSFESIYNIKQRLWNAAYFFSLHGEENIFLKRSININNKKMLVGGSFYSRILSECSKDQKEICKLFKQFLDQLGAFFQFYSLFKTENYGQNIPPNMNDIECDIDLNESKIKQKVSGFCRLKSNKNKILSFSQDEYLFSLKFDLEKRYVFNINGSLLGETCFEKIEMFLKEKNRLDKTSKKKIEITFFIENEGINKIE